MKKVIKVKAIKKENKTVYINTDFIKLDSLLKLCDIAQTGGHAKILVLEGEIEVNGEVCQQRGRKIKPGDQIRYENTVYTVESK